MLSTWPLARVTDFRKPSGLPLRAGMNFAVSGSSIFTLGFAQHSDARILEQLIYKWSHARRVIAECLADSYVGLLRAGYPLTTGRIERDVQRLFAVNFRDWIAPAKLA